MGRLAGGFDAPAGMRCSYATVMAVATWDRESSEPQYQDRLRCDRWEVVVPELVFEPDRNLGVIGVSRRSRGSVCCTDTRTPRCIRNVYHRCSPGDPLFNLPYWASITAALVAVSIVPSLLNSLLQ